MQTRVRLYNSDGTPFEDTEFEYVEETFDTREEADEFVRSQNPLTTTIFWKVVEEVRS